MSVGDVIERIWADLTTPVAAEPRTVLIALGAVLACVVVPPAWHVVRHGVTVVHEAGHAVVAALLGREVRGITLHSDTSGATVSSGAARRLPLALKALAGYPAPAVAGLGAAAALGEGYASAVLWATVLLLLLVLVRVRNAYGVMVVVIGAGGLGWAAWAADGEWRVGLAYGIAWLLLVGAVRAVVELSGSRARGRGRGSDADALARLTRVPGGAWVVVFWLVAVACAALGGWWLVGGAAAG